MKELVIRAQDILAPVGKGMAGSFFIGCDDGKEYVVKFLKEKGNRLFVNEFLGSAFCRFLNTPSPPFRLVDFDEDIALELSRITSNSVSAGLYPGTERVVDSRDLCNEIPTSLEPISNSSHMPNIVTFDNWLVNGDRSGCNLLVSTSGGQNQILAIDNGHILGGPTWTLETLRSISNNDSLQRTHKIITENIVGSDPFKMSLLTLENVDRNAIENVLESIPSSWISDKDKVQNVIIDITDKRKMIVRTIITRNKGLFPKWG